jgi:isoamylase
VNFVTCHDGFTLADLVSYEHRHNEANGEDNADGPEQNYSRNWGVEGPSDSVRLQRLRDRMKRNLFTTLLCSQGVRMLLAGDEIGRTQRGNNNAYCQDNVVSWLEWDLDEQGHELCAFVRRLVEIVDENPILRRRDFLSGDDVPGTGMKDVTWIRPDGEEMTERDWANPENRVLGMLLNGGAADELDPRGRMVRGDTLLLLLNAGVRPRSWTLPKVPEPGRWEELVNTARPSPFAREVRAHTLTLGAQSSILLRRAG